MRIRISRSVLILLVGFVAWSGLELFGLLRTNPFEVAREAAVVAGGWSPEQVRFERGSYQFLFVCSVSSAEVAVTTPDGETSAEIELLHVPLIGWSIRSFEIG